ncbi:MAG: mechanosensitive ion channel domain-containing protein [Anaerolineae bacterium]
MRKRLPLVLILSLAMLLAWSFVARQPILAAQETPATPEARPAQSTAASPAVSTTPAVEEAQEPTPEPTDVLEGVIVTRTPEPTATPGRVEQQVEELVETAGLGRATFLGLAVVNWINLAISLLYVLVGYLGGTWLIRSLLPRIVRRTRTDFDDRALEAIGDDVRWLVVLLALHMATARLTFVRAALKTLLGDAYFVVGLFLAVRITFRLISLADEWARQRSLETGHNVELLENVTVLLTRVGRVVTMIVGLMILLTRFGIDVTALGAALGLGGLALTLAAQDTIADMIAGIIILVDRPFRIGDRIEIQEAGTWGDVLDIGLRTTRIRTRDNRVIILPNSTIGSNQVMNYSYPDPSYRSETHLSVGYDTDLEVARRLIVDTVAGVDGVLADRSIDALYIEMGDSGVTFRVRWWIASYAALRRNLDQVHTALQAAFDRAGIPFASPTQNITLRADAGTVRRVSSALREGRGAGSRKTNDA